MCCHKLRFVPTTNHLDYVDIVGYWFQYFETAHGEYTQLFWNGQSIAQDADEHLVELGLPAAQLPFLVGQWKPIVVAIGHSTLP